MSEKKMMTEEELMNADLSTLSGEEMSRRSLMINIRKQEREYEMIGFENEKFRTAKEERERMRRIAIANAEAERLKTKAEQDGCAHNTGGEGLAGFFSGDGAIYGSCTAGLELPTGEVYYLCFRCQKEWHRPSKRKVLDGKMTLEEYYRQDREYVEIARRPRKSFAPWNGEFCAASKFTIPTLIMQKARDDAEFEGFLKQHAKA